MPPPTDQDLLRIYIEGGLEELLANTAKSDPDSLDELARRVDSVREFAQLLREANWETPPPSIQRFARSVQTSRPSLRMLVAKLWNPEPNLRPAFRGSGPAPQIFRAEHIELSILRTSGGAILGEVQLEEATTATAPHSLCSLFGDQGTHQATLDEDGAFRLPDVPVATWKLVLDLQADGQDLMFVVPSLEL